MVVENKKIGIDAMSEKITIKYPDGHTRVLE
jgi:hypothetical protein